MEILEVVINSALGIHARPACILAKFSNKYSLKLTIQKADMAANAKEVMDILSLCIKSGERIRFYIEGDEEKRVAEELHQFIKTNINSEFNI